MSRLHNFLHNEEVNPFLDDTLPIFLVFALWFVLSWLRKPRVAVAARLFHYVLTQRPLEQTS